MLLIGGYPRSGTSLLRFLCNSHPRMAVTREFGCFLSTGSFYRTYKSNLLRRWRNQGILTNRFFRSTDDYHWVEVLKGHLFTARFLLKLRKYGGKRIEAEQVEEILHELFPHAVVVGDKTPEYVYKLDKLIEIPDSVCAIIYRDCRDVVSSYLKRVAVWRNQHVQAHTVEEVAERWVHAIENMELYRERLHLVQYEKLVRQPAVELRALANRLNLDPDGFPTGIVQTESVGKHKEGLTKEQLNTLMNIAGPAMSRLGYV